MIRGSYLIRISFYRRLSCEIMGLFYNYCVVFFFLGGIFEEELDFMVKYEFKEDYIF